MALTLALGLSVGCGAVASATVLTFDNLNIPDRSAVPDGYGGVTWNGNWLLFTDGYAPYIPASPPNSTYLNYNALPAAFTAPINFGAPVVFNGADFSGYSSANVTFELYLNGTLEHTSSTLTASGAPTYLSSGYSSLVNEVDVVTNQSGYFVMDNFTFIGVPEPATWVMLILGMSTVGAILRRRKATGRLSPQSRPWGRALGRGHGPGAALLET